METEDRVELVIRLLSAVHHTCGTCGHIATEHDELDENPVTFGSDPYASEIGGDDTEVWECESCRRESAWEI